MKPEEALQQLRESVKESLLNGEIKLDVTLSFVPNTASKKWYNAYFYIDNIKCLISTCESYEFNGIQIFTVCVHTDLLKGMFTKEEEHQKIHDIIINTEAQHSDKEKEIEFYEQKLKELKGEI